MRFRLDPIEGGYSIRAYGDASSDRRCYATRNVLGELPLTHKAELRNHIYSCAEEAAETYARTHGVYRYSSLGEGS